MLIRFHKLRAVPDDDRINDLSVLCPAEQDRVYELGAKLSDAESLPAITDEELLELEKLFESTPLIHPGDPPGGPDLTIPGVLGGFWSGYQGKARMRTSHFGRKLKAVQKFRFVELCRQYGWQEGVPVSSTMQPLNMWSDNDYHEMTALLDIASRRN
jgi:hypothetical protein